jgi:hypothetical protein
LQLEFGTFSMLMGNQGMYLKYAPGFLAILFFALILMIATRVSGQAGVPPRITQPIDNTKLITLRGNLHPMAA